MKGELKGAVERLTRMVALWRQSAEENYKIDFPTVYEEQMKDVGAVEAVLAALSQLKSAPVGSGAGVPLNQHGQVAGLFKDASSPALSPPEGPPAMGVEEVARDNEKLRAAILWALGEGDSDFAEPDPPIIVAGRVARYWWRKELRERAGAALSPQPVPARGEEGVG